MLDFQEMNKVHSTNGFLPRFSRLDKKYVLNRVGIASGLPLSQNGCNRLYVFFWQK